MKPSVWVQIDPDDEILEATAFPSAAIIFRTPARENDIDPLTGRSSNSGGDQQWQLYRGSARASPLLHLGRDRTGRQISSKQFDMLLIRR
jgi:hypothetical protein